MSFWHSSHYTIICGVLKNAIHNTMPIWYNTKICTYFNKEWFNKGIKFVSDLFFEKKFVTLEYFHKILGVKCNFLEYANIKIENIEITG